MDNSCIYLVANRRSERDLANLVYSIRASGCSLDINLIPFGGQPVAANEVLKEVNIMRPEAFPLEAHRFLEKLQQELRCPSGFLRRFLAFFGPYERFIYSDNDIVALSNWQCFIDPLDHYDLVHADMEYTTASRYNFSDPSILESAFGPTCHDYAMTAGHFSAKRSAHLINALSTALTWMIAHPKGCYMHDQSLMQIASLVGPLNCLNLCKPPASWLSSWAGDHKNTLSLIHQINEGSFISHIHYSGGPTGRFVNPIDELLLSSCSPKERLLLNTLSGSKSLLGFNSIYDFFTNTRRWIKVFMHQ